MTRNPLKDNKYIASIGLGMILFGSIFAIIITEQNTYAGTFNGSNGKIAFQSDRDGNAEIYTMNPDGRFQTNITNNDAVDGNPSWSPDGTKIAFRSDRDFARFSDIYIVNITDLLVNRLTDTEGPDGTPSWSPDGTKIAFTGGGAPDEIFVINADGSLAINITNNDAVEFNPDWQPLNISDTVESLIDNIENDSLNKNVENSLLGPLKKVSKILDDGNPDNDIAVCDKLDEFIANVESKRDSGKIDNVIADELLSDALLIQLSISCI